MATRFYLHNAAAPYTPATIRGEWDSTASSVTKLLDTGKTPSNVRAYTQISASGAADYSYLHYRGVTGTLAAGTIGTGTVNLCVSFREDSAGTDAYWRVHIYVTAGDSDTVRGTLLDHYAETSTNELPVAVNNASSLQSAQALASVVVSNGDRIVVELGLVKRGATTSNCLMVYGCDSGAVAVAVGEEAWAANRVAWIEFSETISGSSSIVGRVSQATVEAAFGEVTADARVSHASVETAFGEAAAEARVSHAAAEVVILTDNEPLRVSQVVGELVRSAVYGSRVSQVVAELLAPSIVSTVVTQLVAEVMYPTINPAAITQMVAELLDAGVHPVRVSQIVVELLGKSSTYCGPPSLSPAALCGKPDVLAWLEWTVPMKN